MKHALTNFYRWLDTRTVKQDYLLCFVMGLLNALAMPPVYCVPILLVTFPVLIRLLDKAPLSKQVFFKTFFFFFGFHVAGLYWINFALLVDIANNWWVLPFALSGLPMLMAIYPAFGAFFWHRLAWKGSARLLALIVIFAASDWIRGWAFTGFPWNLWGYTWVFFAPMLQSTALTGMYGLTLITLVIVCIPVFFWKNYQDRFGRIFLTGFAVLMIVLLAWGTGRLNTPLPQSEHPFIVRIVQPNIEQEAKWQPGAREQHERKLWTLSIQPTPVMPNIILWPETSIPLVGTEDVRHLEAMLQELLPEHSILAAGIADVQFDPDTNQSKVFNRIGFYDRTGHRIGFYDKFHLVPFGEFLPFEKYWPVKPVAFSGGSMSRGPGLQTFHIDNTPPFSALICYEVLFPGETVLHRERPQWILNVTNDAWYGNTSGPYQHLAIARARAVEEGLPLVRAANTGVSAVIDPMGRIVASLPLGTDGYLDQALPASLQRTVFGHYGNWIFLMMLTLVGGLAWIGQRQRSPAIRHVE